MLIGGAAILALVVVLMGLAVQRWAADRRAIADELVHDELDTLEYVVPNGQDPAEVLSALRMEGYVAALDPVTPSRLVHVECPGGRDRERARVRAVIGQAASAIQDGARMGGGPVRFVDEPLR